VASAASLFGKSRRLFFIFCERSSTSELES
jgi:hypothetical protein